MTIDPTTLSTLGAGGAGGVGIWFVMRALFGKIETMKEQLDEFKLKCAEKYVTTEALHELKSDIDKRFDRLESILNNGSH